MNKFRLMVEREKDRDEFIDEMDIDKSRPRLFERDVERDEEEQEFDVDQVFSTEHEAIAALRLMKKAFPYIEMYIERR